MRRKRLLRITTVPVSLRLLLHGQLEYMQQHGFDVLAVSAAGDDTAYLRAQGIPHQSILLTRKITPLRDIIAIFQLVKIILRFKPDIVHSHTPKAGLIGMAAAWICRVPVRLHTVAGLPLMEAKGLKRRMLKVVEKITYTLATAVFPNSFGLRDFIAAELGDFKKIRVIGKGSSNGIDAAFFQKSDALMEQAGAIRTKYLVTDNELVFSFAGRIVGDKGILELVEAFKKLASEIPARLMLIGSYEDVSPIAQGIKTFIETDARVIHPGFQSDIRPWFLASDIFVFPSYREGFPNVVMQAACLGRPCIVTDINGCNEIIRDHHSGLLVLSKDAHALYMAMKLLAENPDERRAYAAQAREHVTANFDQSYVWHEILKTYTLATS